MEKINLEDLLGIKADEKTRLKFLKKELAMRKKQPEAWTKTKYRAYANFKTKKREAGA